MHSSTHDPTRQLGAALRKIKVRCCRRCHCTETERMGCIRRTGRRCYWVERDLCSACLLPSEYGGRFVTLSRPLELIHGEPVYPANTVFIVERLNRLGILILAVEYGGQRVRVRQRVPINDVTVCYREKIRKRPKRSLLKDI
jgi:hypothetical protein